MNNLQTHIKNYLENCSSQKRLDEKTLKAYQIDLRQFFEKVTTTDIQEISPDILEKYIGSLHQIYKPKTVKRKIASLKAFFHYLEYRDILDKNPFNKIQVRFREPTILPKTIPLQTVETFLSTIYDYQENAKTAYRKRNAIRDAAVIELLFATGIRISELCMLTIDSVNLSEGIILIYGKGDKERRIQIGNEAVIDILKNTKTISSVKFSHAIIFFVNQAGKPLTDQAIRRMINKYTSLASIQLHITPHMFRHTFATSLLEADVDIRYIQPNLPKKLYTV